MSLTLGSGPLGGHPAGAFNFDLDGAAPKHRIYFAEEQRRLRAVVDDTVVLDTTRARLLYETGIAPRIYAPLEDYALDAFARTDTSTHCPFKGDASYWTLRINGRTENDVLWTYEQPLPDATFIAGYAALYEKRVDAWFVEDDRVFAHLRDPFHRVDVHDSSREVVVRINGEELVRTTRAKLLFETGIGVRAYVPSTDIRPDVVRPGSGKRTVCPYKGEAHYWTVADVEDAAWSYDAPLPDALRAAGHLSFDDALDAVEVSIA